MKLTYQHPTYKHMCSKCIHIIRIWSPHVSSRAIFFLIKAFPYVLCMLLVLLIFVHFGIFKIHLYKKGIIKKAFQIKLHFTYFPICSDLMYRKRWIKLNLSLFVLSNDKFEQKPQSKCNKLSLNEQMTCLLIVW